MVAKFKQPDYNTQTGTEYPLAIDAAVAVLAELAGQFAVAAQDTPNLTVAMRAGRVYKGDRTIVAQAAQNSAALTAPTVNPRNDIVYIDATTGVGGVVVGAEAASPIDPAIPANKLPKARIRWIVGMAQIANSALDDLRFDPPSLDAIVDYLGAVALDDVVPVVRGGTGSVTAAAARSALGAAGLADANTWTNTQTMSGKSIIEANASIAAHATTMDPWRLGNYVTATGVAVTFTDLADAPQAGAEAEIYMNVAHTWADNANLEVDGDANWTAEAGDRVLVRAKAATGPFVVKPRRKGGSVVVNQVISTASGTASVATGTTALPDDNSIPQNTDGDQYLSVSITPKSTTNRLFIEVLIHGFASANNSWSAALFQDDVVDALTAAKVVTTPNTNVLPLYFAWEMAAGTVSSTTFKVKAGQSAGATFTFNGQAGATWFNGALNSYIRVTEMGR